MGRRRRNKINLKYFQIFIAIILSIYIIGYIFIPDKMDYIFLFDINNHITSGSSNNIPQYNGQSYIILDSNVPNFDEELINTKSFEQYSELDKLGRCGEAIANIGVDLMPTEKRGTIGSVKPAGWHTIKYDIVNIGVRSMKVVLELTSYKMDIPKPYGFFHLSFLIIGIISAIFL